MSESLELAVQVGKYDRGRVVSEYGNHVDVAQDIFLSPS